MNNLVKSSNNELTDTDRLEALFSGNIKLVNLDGQIHCKVFRHGWPRWITKSYKTERQAIDAAIQQYNNTYKG